MNIRSLGGHSGCRILLYEKDDNTTFVRKISGDRDYNDRLKIQAEKQVNYSNKHILVPDVLGKGMNEDGLFYFDMEYIQGITLAEYIKTIEVSRVRNIVHIIVDNIIDTQSNNAADEIAFLDKIASLKNKLLSKNNCVINSAIEVLENHCWNMFKRTACHGDLTMENIIVKENQLYLIDFLDSFYDCWIMDISSLMQDVQTMWSYRNEEIDNNTLIRLIVFRDILMDEVKKVSGDIYIEVYYALLLKLIRSYPYTKDEDTYCYLNEKTISVLNIIGGISS